MGSDEEAITELEPEDPASADEDAWAEELASVALDDASREAADDDDDDDDENSAAEEDAACDTAALEAPAEDPAWELACVLDGAWEDASEDDNDDDPPDVPAFPDEEDELLDEDATCCTQAMVHASRRQVAYGVGLRRMAVPWGKVLPACSRQRRAATYQSGALVRRAPFPTQTRHCFFASTAGAAPRCQRDIAGP